jgi:hypothetical protein
MESETECPTEYPTCFSNLLALRELLPVAWSDTGLTTVVVFVHSAIRLFGSEHVFGFT